MISPRDPLHDLYVFYRIYTRDGTSTRVKVPYGVSLTVCTVTDFLCLGTEFFGKFHVLLPRPLLRESEMWTEYGLLMKKSSNYINQLHKIGVLGRKVSPIFPSDMSGTSVYYTHVRTEVVNS